MSSNRRTSRKVFGASKVREMQRSVLPSTRRKGARTSLEKIRRQGRHRVNRCLLAYRGPVEAVIDDFDDDTRDLRWWPQHLIKDEVFERRGADKLGPLFRWGIARTEHLDPRDRLDALRLILADNLIGRHALSHLAWARELRSPDDPTNWWWYRVDLPPSRERDDLERAVRAALDGGRHAAMNRWLKAQAVIGTGVRGTRVVTDVPLLGGVHDVERFCGAVWLDRELVAGFLDYLRRE